MEDVTAHDSLFPFRYRAPRGRVCDRQFICSRCGRLGCLDLICHGGVDV